MNKVDEGKVDFKNSLTHSVIVLRIYYDWTCDLAQLFVFQYV